jgi:hypothetical protein
MKIMEERVDSNDINSINQFGMWYMDGEELLNIKQDMAKLSSCFTVLLSLGLH